MSAKRNILQEKLQSIDHGLDVEQLWGELEPKLPTSTRKRRPMIWLWCMVGVLLLSFVGWVAHEYTHVADDVATSRMSISAGSTVDDAPPVKPLVDRVSQKGVENTNSDNSSLIALAEEDSRENSNTTAMKTTTATDLATMTVSAVENRSSVVQGERSTTSQTTDLAVAVSETKNTSIGEQDATEQSRTIVATQDLPKIAKRSTLQDDKASSRQSSAVRSTVRGGAKAVQTESHDSRLPLQFPYIYSSCVEGLSVDDPQLLLATIHPRLAVIEPIKENNRPRFAFALLTGYGRDLASSGAAISDSTSTGRGVVSNSTHKEVWNVEAQLSARLYRGLGVTGNIQFERYTDEQRKERLTTTETSSLADGGYNIKTQGWQVLAYENTDTWSLGLSAFYELPLAKSFSLRPEVGVRRYFTSTFQDKSIAESIVPDNFVSTSTGTATLSNSYFARLALETHLTTRLSLSAGATFAARTFTGEVLPDSEDSGPTSKQQLLTGQVGLRYSF